ncbi:beta-lactamase class C [Pseudochelatococcus lubricantis]|uniref:Beta-lactamase n=1 Tax=Pseudochelatococcus lubricantis TaxID=1538102 RepID=A0ABX0V0L2_9HYPH|nr:class C beta-lactamase [Pseudochelatococcus lubricantis]NIJ58742.1 beta-lactamase class C [Pseudochelatococcus lubricantis]
MKSVLLRTLTFAAAITLSALPALAADTVRATVDAVIKPLMAEHDLPGLSVAILHDGKRHVFHYGVASRKTRSPVNDKTLFEIGSLSKPFTGTLLARLEAEGLVDLSASAQTLLPEIAGSPIGGASLLDLHTYVAGGLPLQFPAGVDKTNFAKFFRSFKPTAKIGASRLYSNPSIGLSGYLAAVTAGQPFSTLLTGKVLAPLKLEDTFLKVPANRMANYAQGYTRDNAPVRVSPGLFDHEAYGVKTTASDLLRFVEASVNPAGLGSDLETALVAARTGVYRVGSMHQGLGWELYRAPARSAELLQGADPAFVLEPNAVERPEAPVTGAAVGTVSKTGSTLGFGAYALFQPARGTAIVILANRFWANPARIEAAYAILDRIDPGFTAD